MIVLVLACSAMVKPGLGLRVEQELSLSGEEMEILLTFLDLQTGNLTISWPVSWERVLRGPTCGGDLVLGSPGPGRNLSFDLTRPEEGGKTWIELAIQFPIHSGDEIEFPIPTFERTPVEMSLDVLLPPGWTATSCTAECEKVFEPDTGSIRLRWEHAGGDGNRATVQIPGAGEDCLRRQLRRLLLRSAVFWVSVGVLLAIVGGAAWGLLRHS